MAEQQINIRSEEVQEVLSHVPKWTIRWGISLIFGLILLVLTLSWFIKYPEIIKGDIVITTEVTPIRLTTQSDGTLSEIYVSNGDFVDKDTPIVVLENPLNQDAVSVLNSIIDSLPVHIKNKQLGEFEFFTANLSFGDLQDPVNRLITNTKEYYNCVLNDYNEKRISNLKAQIKHHQRLSGILSNQIHLSQSELINASEKFDADKKLFEKGIISKIDFFDEQTKFIQKKQSLEQLKTNVVQNNITITGFEKQLLEMVFEQDEKIRQLLQEIETIIDLIQNQILGWQQQYVLKAPYSGRINFLDNLTEKQFVVSGTQLFAVVPEDNNILGYIKMPSRGFGKIKKGQRVNIQVTNYPQHEFGQLQGEVVTISNIPSVSSETNESYYLVKIIFPNGLLTTYNRELPLTGEMLGTADIVTEDLRVIERVFNQFRTLFDN